MVMTIIVIVMMTIIIVVVHYCYDYHINIMTYNTLDYTQYFDNLSITSHPIHIYIYIHAALYIVLNIHPINWDAMYL